MCYKLSHLNLLRGSVTEKKLMKKSLKQKLFSTEDAGLCLIRERSPEGYIRLCTLAVHRSVHGRCVKTGKILSASSISVTVFNESTEQGRIDWPWGLDGLVDPKAAPFCDCVVINVGVSSLGVFFVRSVTYIPLLMIARGIFISIFYAFLCLGTVRKWQRSTLPRDPAGPM